MLAPVPPKGTPLLRRVLETWLGSGVDEVIVVLGNDADMIRGTIEENLLRNVKRGESAAAAVRFVENPNWKAGMFSSVKAGVAATSVRSTHIAVSPADLPFLSKGTLRTVI